MLPMDVRGPKGRLINPIGTREIKFNGFCAHASHVPRREPLGEMPGDAFGELRRPQRYEAATSQCVQISIHVLGVLVLFLSDPLVLPSQLSMFQRDSLNQRLPSKSKPNHQSGVT